MRQLFSAFIVQGFMSQTTWDARIWRQTLENNPEIGRDVCLAIRQLDSTQGLKPKAKDRFLGNKSDNTAVLSKGHSNYRGFYHQYFTARLPLEDSESEEY